MALRTTNIVGTRSPFLVCARFHSDGSPGPLPELVMKEWAGDGFEELLAMERLRDLELLTPYGFAERHPGGDGQHL